MIPTSVLVVVLFLACTANSLLLQPFANLHVLDNITDTIQEHTSTCECRSICMANLSCTCVSVTRLTSSKVSCAFATVPCSKGLIVASGKQVTTYVKSVPCPPPFTYHVDVGCYFLSTAQVHYIVAKQSCPPGSALATPATDNLFRVMMAYLATLGATNSGFWIGLGRNSTSIPFGWSNGRSLSADLWAAGNPSGNSQCAVAFKTNGFLFNDVGCSTNFNFVCIRN